MALFRPSGQIRHFPAAAALLAATLLAGCGIAAAPQPPSLQLPKRVGNLTATRTGDDVLLQWKAPTQTTDKEKIVHPIRTDVCRQTGTAACETVGTATATPGKAAEYRDTLPAALRNGPLRPVEYRVAGLSPHGRKGPGSNSATVLAGAAPPAVAGLSATVVARGVLLRWQPAPALPYPSTVRLERTLVTTPQPGKTGHSAALSGGAAPATQLLQVPVEAKAADPGTALDTSAAFGVQYRYSASRTAALEVTTQTPKPGTQVLRASSAASPPIVVVTRDTFPPAAPTGLVAVPVSAALNGGHAEVDLSWQANTEPDLAQYRVYRADLGVGNAGAGGALQAVPLPAGASAMVAPAFRDLDVIPGHRYAYAVTAIDQAGNESPRSATVEATVPGH